MLLSGGQILRNAASLACLLETAVKVCKIRAGRSNPGLRPQHLSGLMLLRDLSNSKLVHGEVGSTEVTLIPKSIGHGQFLADTKTAGSVGLLIQSALPCLCFGTGPCEITLRGGTNAEMAPQIDYFDLVLRPIIARTGFTYESEIRKRGYFPKGGGEVVLRAEPVKQLQPITLTHRGNLMSITGRAFVAGTLPAKISHIMATEATTFLRSAWPGVPVTITAVQEPPHIAVGNGTGIILVAETDTGCRLASSGLGKRGVRAEDVALQAANELCTALKDGGCVDQHLQDQLVIFMALASGQSRVLCGPLTDHTKTAIHVVEQMTKARFDVEKTSESTNTLICDGIGLTNKHLQ